jgi:hypothetical protein
MFRYPLLWHEGYSMRAILRELMSYRFMQFRTRNETCDLDPRAADHDGDGPAPSCCDSNYLTIRAE